METDNYFLATVREHLNLIAREEKLKGRTIGFHNAQYNKIDSFLTAAGKENITVSQVNISLIDEFKEWLYTKTKITSRTHVSRHLRLCREAMHHAVRRGYLDSNCLTSVHLKRDREKVPVSLTTQELNKIEDYEPKSALWRQVKDLFLFQCYTGLSYMDLGSFQLVDDKILTQDGNSFDITWVTSPYGRGKTGRPYWVELTEAARRLLIRHQGDFEVPHNQTYNRVIKKIAARAGVDKYITSHIGRKTFATYMRTQGYSISAVADMLGNTEAVARRHYIEHTKECIMVEMIRVNKWSHYNNKAS